MFVKDTDLVKLEAPSLRVLLIVQRRGPLPIQMDSGDGSQAWLDEPPEDLKDLIKPHFRDPDTGQVHWTTTELGRATLIAANRGGLLPTLGRWSG